MAEAESIFSPQELTGGLAEICDDCYNAFMAWMAASPHAREN